MGYGHRRGTIDVVPAMLRAREPVSSSPTVAPSIVVTLADPRRAAKPDAARRTNDRYLDAIRRAGGAPQPLYPGEDRAVTGAALGQMAGLLMTGGADLDPALYGEEPDGSNAPDRDRDALELAAWNAAWKRRLPVLGLCRGFQAINVFSGGSLAQHVEGHDTAGDHGGEPRTHPLRLVPGSRLARVLRPSDPSGVLRVNSYHHQAIRSAQLAPGLVASGYGPQPDGELVEALESAERDRFVIGIQCHPERLESTPPEFARLFQVFVAAARRVAVDRTSTNAGGAIAQG